MKIKKCKHCGKMFEAYVHNKKYCSEKCYYEAEKIRQKERYKKKSSMHKKKIKELHLGIREILKRASEEGLTYGEYVEKYNI